MGVPDNSTVIRQKPQVLSTLFVSSLYFNSSKNSYLPFLFYTQDKLFHVHSRYDEIFCRLSTSGQLFTPSISGSHLLRQAAQWICTSHRTAVQSASTRQDHTNCPISAHRPPSPAVRSTSTYGRLSRPHRLTTPLPTLPVRTVLQRRGRFIRLLPRPTHPWRSSTPRWIISGLTYQGEICPINFY